MSIGNTRRGTTLVSLIANDVTASTKTGSAVDLQNYEGDLLAILDAEAGGSGVTYAVKFTESDTSGGSYTDVTSGAFTTTAANTASVQSLIVNTDEIKRFVKVVVTVAGGSGTGAVSVSAVAMPKYG
tara:strand:- start:1342 stop:1722 length:381 start_codon:yes stop_codon:yes gene_type:complete